jgi:hypothetical protein
VVFDRPRAELKSFRSLFSGCSLNALLQDLSFALRQLSTSGQVCQGGSPSFHIGSAANHICDARKYSVAAKWLLDVVASASLKRLHRGADVTFARNH